ncbi:MAG: cell division protein SepF [Oscillospiraceae bacterium]|nr:cell division protein SepF [Oscillospiraceae bacterium]
MGFMDEIRRIAHPYEDDEEDDFDDDYDDQPERGSSVRERNRDSYYERDRYDRDRVPESDRRGNNNKVVNIHTTTQLQVVLVKPDRFEAASEIADHLRDKRTVVLNLESTEKEVSRRLLDFLSGVAYANEGKIKKVALATYIITPYNVDIIGDLINDLENNGLYFS